MKKVFLVIIATAVLAACETTSSTNKNSKSHTPDAITLIEVFKRGNNPICVNKTRTEKNNCSGNHNDNVSCNVPGTWVLWVWKANNDNSSSNDIDRPFKITMKTGYASPFDNDAPCSAMSNTVLCRINSEIEPGEYKYNVIVDANDASCNLDPRFLIY